jgi:hypothetical protein
MRCVSVDDAGVPQHVGSRGAEPVYGQGQAQGRVAPASAQTERRREQCSTSREIEGLSLLKWYAPTTMPETGSGVDVEYRRCLAIGVGRR